jgi:putative flippase GtrA
MILNRRRTEIVRFGISGVAGFIVDAGIVALFTRGLGLGTIVAQVIAFTVAVTVTWIINRHWTFAEHASEKWLHEWTRYVAANSVGAAVHNGIYVILVLAFSTFSKNPVLAVAAGALLV